MKWEAQQNRGDYMLKNLKGGLETVIAVVIVAGLVVALLVAVVIPMSQSGDDLINATTDSLTQQQTTIGPQ